MCEILKRTGTVFVDLKIKFYIYKNTIEQTLKYFGENVLILYLNSLVKVRHFDIHMYKISY